jgi:ketosteroid isomerase-like protein
MSSTNLELARSIHLAWERGDYSSVEWAHPEIEFELADGPDPGSWSGVDGMAEGWLAFERTWEDFRAVPTEFRELDHEHVLVLVQFHGRAKASGMELTEMAARQANLMQISAGKVRRLVLYWDSTHAFADLGLAPDAGENAALVERWTDAFNRRDVDALALLVTEDFEWVTTNAGLVEGASFRGRPGIEAYFADVGHTWEEYRLVSEEIRDLGDRVLWLGRAEARGRGSGIALAAPLGAVCDLRDGKVSRLRAFVDHGEALRAAGERERATSEDSTSADLVLLTQRIVDAGNARDVDAMLRFYAPDSVWDMSAVGLGTFEGREAIRGLFEDWFGAYEDYAQEAQEICDLGNGVTFGIFVMRGRSAGGAGWVEQRYAAVATWTDGLIQRTTNSFDIDGLHATAERLATERT